MGIGHNPSACQTTLPSASSEFTSARSRKRCPRPLRRIGCRDPETGKRRVFPTTNFDLSAKTVADIYRSRWLAGTNAILALRAAIFNDRYDDYWQPPGEALPLAA